MKIREINLIEDEINPWYKQNWIWPVIEIDKINTSNYVYMYKFEVEQYVIGTIVIATNTTTWGLEEGVVTILEDSFYVIRIMSLNFIRTTIL